MKTMRVSVVHLRVLMLFVNLALAVGFAVYYVTGLLSPERPTRSVAIVEAEKFRNVRNVRPQGADPSPVVSTAAQYMLPPEPRKPTPVGLDKDTEETVEEEPEEEPTEGGPLAEEWEYVWGIYDQEQPKNSLVMLRKKEGAGTGRTRIGSRSGRRFSTSRNRRAARARALRRRQAQNPDDLITFQVKDRHYIDEDNGIDIWIHKATAEKLVYSEDQNGLPGRPFYALQRTFTTQYEERGTTESLWELAPEEDEEAEEGEEEEKEKFFIVRESQKYEDIREMQYQRALEGERPSGKAVTPRRRRNLGVESSGATSGENVTPARPARPPSTPAGSRASSRTSEGRVTDPEERRKQLQKLEEAVEELPADAQKEIKEALVNPPQRGN